MRGDLIKQQTINATKEIRKKFNDFKRNKAQAQLAYRTQHEQVIKPLQTIAKVVGVNAKQQQQNVKKAKKEVEYEDDDDDKDRYEDAQDLQDESAYDSNSEHRLGHYHGLPQYYAQILSERGPEVDRSRYAARYDINKNKWTLGHTQLLIEGKDIVIKGVTYEGTLGLYSLLTLRDISDSDVSEQDKINYAKIVISANVHRQKYRSNGKIVKYSTNRKYNEIILPYLNKIKASVSGEGVKKRNYKLLNTGKRGGVEYVYWNTLTELVQRLRLLYAANAAGNNSSQNINEIRSIISELHEEGIIE